MKQFINNNQIKKFMRPQCSGREWNVKAKKKKDIAIDPEGCMMREAKANLARIVYMLLKRMAGEVPTYLTA